MRKEREANPTLTEFQLKLLSRQAVDIDALISERMKGRNMTSKELLALQELIRQRQQSDKDKLVAAAKDSALSDADLEALQQQLWTQQQADLESLIAQSVSVDTVSEPEVVTVEEPEPVAAVVELSPPTQAEVKTETDTVSVVEVVSEAPVAAESSQTKEATQIVLENTHTVEVTQPDVPDEDADHVSFEDSDDLFGFEDDAPKNPAAAAKRESNPFADLDSQTSETSTELSLNPFGADNTRKEKNEEEEGYNPFDTSSTSIDSDSNAFVASFPEPVVAQSVVAQSVAEPPRKSFIKTKSAQSDVEPEQAAPVAATPVSVPEAPTKGVVQVSATVQKPVTASRIIEVPPPRRASDVTRTPTIPTVTEDENEPIASSRSMSRTFSTPIYVPESPKSQRAAETDEPAEVKDTAVRAFMVSKGLLLCC